MTYFTDKVKPIWLDRCDNMGITNTNEAITNFLDFFDPAPKQYWKMWDDVFTGEKRNELRRRILDQYELRGRYYHNICHLRHLCDFATTHFPNEISQAFVLAAYFHDFIYVPGVSGCEELSAEACRFYGQAMLRLDDDTENQAARAILATKHNGFVDSRLAAVLCDSDLSVLGEKEHLFDEYETKVRHEYYFLSDEQFKAGRHKIVRMFLNREHIFHTEEIRNSVFEKRARKNLERSLRKTHRLKKKYFV